MDRVLNVEREGDEEALLQLYAAGDRRAAAKLAAALLPAVLRHAQRMLGDAFEAEDVAQEAMMRLWRHASDWHPGRAKLSTWLYRVTANLCIDRLRKKKAGSLEDAAEPMDPGQSADERLQERSRVDALQHALLQLPERQRQAVVLRHIEGLPNDEIGEIMDISTRAVESLTARGKAALAAALSARRSELGYENDG